MRYVSWATFYEGNTDSYYFDVIIPRIMNDLILKFGKINVDIPESPSIRLGSRDRSIQAFAAEACASKDAFDIIFVHADTGGRSLERGLTTRAAAYCASISEKCDWPCERCIVIAPRHETEAWILADGDAVTRSLGYSGSPGEIGLPTSAQEAERLSDPKQVLKNAIEIVAGRRRSHSSYSLFPAIAQRQRLDLIRASQSFLDFESRLTSCLRNLHCI